MHPEDHTGAVTKRGPITQIMNGKGVRPWLAEKICEPGYVYLATRLMTQTTPPGQTHRVCWRCVRGVEEHVEGHTVVEWEDAPPDPAERCPRCERLFGEQMP